MQDERLLRDPASGYASADVLEPESTLIRPAVGERHTDATRDAMSGYASADVLDPADPSNRVRSDELDEERQDAMSGYASADAFDPDGDDSA